MSTDKTRDDLGPQEPTPMDQAIDALQKEIDPSLDEIKGICDRIDARQKELESVLASVKRAPQAGCVQSAVAEAAREAVWQRENFADDATQERLDMATACVIAEFLSRVPVGTDAGTLLAEVREIADG